MRNLVRALAATLAVLALSFSSSAAEAQVRGNAPPEESVLDSLSRLYEPVVFPHAMHLDIAENCNVCHHQHGHTAGSPACDRCHKLTPEAFKKLLTLENMAPCRTCHPAAINVDDPGTPTLQAAYHLQCLSCHEEADALKGNPKYCTAVCHAHKKTAAR